jgi:hypothetical protein
MHCWPEGFSTIVKKPGEPLEIAGFPALAKPIGVQDLLTAIDANLTVPA